MEMIDWPFPLAEIKPVRDEYARHLAICRFQAMWKMVLPGIFALIVGIFITLQSVLLTNEKGGFHFIAHGLLIYGVVSLIVGLVRWYRAG